MQSLWDVSLMLADELHMHNRGPVSLAMLTVFYCAAAVAALVRRTERGCRCGVRADLSEDANICYPVMTFLTAQSHLCICLRPVHGRLVHHLGYVLCRRRVFAVSTVLPARLCRFAKRLHEVHPRGQRRKRWTSRACERQPRRGRHRMDASNTPLSWTDRGSAG